MRIKCTIAFSNFFRVRFIAVVKRDKVKVIKKSKILWIIIWQWQLRKRTQSHSDIQSKITENKPLMTCSVFTIMEINKFNRFPVIVHVLFYGCVQRRRIKQTRIQILFLLDFRITNVTLIDFPSNSMYKLTSKKRKCYLPSST